MGRLRIDRLTTSPVPLAQVGGPVVLPVCHRALTRRARLVGLLFTPDLGTGEGVWLAPCSSVHTVGLAAPIGVAFLDSRGIVLRVLDPLPPGRAARCRGARAVVEAAAGTFAGLRPGVRLVPAAPAASVFFASSGGGGSAGPARSRSEGPDRGPAPRRPEVTP